MAPPERLGPGQPGSHGGGPGTPIRAAAGGRLLYILGLVWLLFEVVVVILVGARIGVLSVIGLLALSTLLGIIVVARAGSRAWTALRADANQGIVPGRELGNPVILLVAGIFLILPGLVSSALSIIAIILLPLTRTLIKTIFRVLFGVRMPPGVVPGQPIPGMRGSTEREHADDVIEGEIIDETPPPEDPEPPTAR